MKKFFLLLYSFLFIIIIPACKKERHVTSDNIATFNVINGIVNKTALIKMNGGINTSGIYGGGDDFRIYFGENRFFFNEAKSTDVAVLNSADSSVLATKNIDFKKGGIYTMLLAGIAPNAEAVVIDDSNTPQIDPSTIPTNADSVIYVRFINLAPDVQPLDIKIQGSTSNETSSLAFKQASSFKAYPGKVTAYFGTIGYSTITFEFKESGNVLKTFTLFIYTPLSRFKNLALVLTGMKNPGPGQPGLNVSQIYYQF